MDFLTAFLIVLIVALIIGNFLLSVTEPKEKQAFARGSETERLLMPSDTLSAGNVSLIHEKLDRIERSISERYPSVAEAQQDELLKKLEALVNFKREMTIEVEALKDQMKDVKGSARQDRAQKEIEIDNQRLHDLIYNSGK